MLIRRGRKLKFIAAAHEDPKNPAAFKKILLRKEDLADGRIQMINWAKLLPGKSFRRHYHQDLDEIFIIVSGKVKMVIDKEEEVMQKGDTVIIPPRSVHQMKNIGKCNLEYIVIGITKTGKGKTIVI